MKTTMLKSQLCSIVICILAGFACIANADGASITFTPNPLQLGLGSTYTVNGPFPATVATFNWQYREDGVSCTTGWGPLSQGPNNTQSINVYETRPGNFEVRCTITYAGDSGHPKPHPPDVVIVSVYVPGPSNFSIITGLDTPGMTTTTQPTSTATTGSNGIVFKFKMQAGGKDVGYYLGGSPQVQELIANQELYGFELPDETVWGPISYDARFYLGSDGSLAIIFDFKHTTANNDFTNQPVGSIYYTCTQKIRILFKDGCGKTRYYTLGSSNQKWRKLSDTTWEVESK